MEGSNSQYSNWDNIVNTARMIKKQYDENEKGIFQGLFFMI